MKILLHKFGGMAQCQYLCNVFHGIRFKVNKGWDSAEPLFFVHKPSSHIILVVFQDYNSPLHTHISDSPHKSLCRTPQRFMQDAKKIKV